jgi:hypothetical protein
VAVAFAKELAARVTPQPPAPIPSPFAVAPRVAQCVIAEVGIIAAAADGAQRTALPRRTCGLPWRR